MDKTIIGDEAWIAIANNEKIWNVKCYKRKITFFVRRKKFLRGYDVYKVTLERNDEEYDSYLTSTVEINDIIVKDKLHQLFYSERLLNNKYFHFIDLYFTGIRSFEKEQREMGLQEFR